MKKNKIIRITTVPISLKILLKNQLKFMSQYYEVVGVSSAGKELDDVKKRTRVRTINLGMSREISLFKDLVSLLKMIFMSHNYHPSDWLYGALEPETVFTNAMQYPHLNNEIEQ